MYFLVSRSPWLAELSLSGLPSLATSGGDFMAIEKEKRVLLAVDLGDFAGAVKLGFFGGAAARGVFLSLSRVFWLASISAKSFFRSGS